MGKNIEEQFNDELCRIMEEVKYMRMPFGRFGPGQFPPDGLPIYDLPYEYLAWFQRKGFPKGKLGELLEFVYKIKRDSADEIFNSFRHKTGRTSLRQPQRRQWDFNK